MKQNPRALPLDGWQIRALQKDRLSHLWFPILNWPPKIYLPHMVRSELPSQINNYSPAKPGVFQPMSNQCGALAILTDATKGEEGWLGVKPDEWEWVSPWGSEGSRVWVQETWMPHTEDGTESGAVLYRSTDRPEPDGQRPLRWRPSTQMSRRASRYTLELLRVDALLLGDTLTDTAARQAGLGGIEAFEDWWNRKHERKALRFNRGMEGVVPIWARPKKIPYGHLVTANPWAWRLTVKKVNHDD